jgi:hypothetical protein
MRGDYKTIFLTYDQEIDYIEESGGKYGFEFNRGDIKQPDGSSEAYPGAELETITPENFESSSWFRNSRSIKVGLNSSI